MKQTTPDPRGDVQNERDAGSPDSRLHDELMQELEDHTPEGRGPRRRTVRRELFLFAPLVVTSIVGGTIALHHIGGWGAVTLGVVFFLVYYGLGWWPVLAAGLLRKKQRDQLERIVADEIEEHHHEGHETARASPSNPIWNQENQRPSDS